MQAQGSEPPTYCNLKIYSTIALANELEWLVGLGKDGVAKKATKELSDHAEY